jgi:hypothetical protein
MKTNKIFSLIVLLVVSLGSFFVGMKYQQKKLSSNFGPPIQFGNPQDVGRNMRPSDINNADMKNRGQMPDFRQTLGEIINTDNQSITVKLVDGSSKIVWLSDSTLINQSVEASVSDLKTGIKVAVHGETNSDGSITGKNIEINPAFATMSPAPTQL